MRRMLWLVLLVVILPGGALVALALYAAHRLPATPAVLIWARVWALIYRVPWTLQAAILHNEGASQLRPATAREAEVLGVIKGHKVYPVGDLDHGTALGPGQVLRRNVVRLWSSANALERVIAVGRRPEDLALAGNERLALWASVQVLKEALVTEKGDLHRAARRYNGSGDRAEAYARRADAFRSAYKGAPA